MEVFMSEATFSFLQIRHFDKEIHSLIAIWNKCSSVKQKLTQDNIQEIQATLRYHANKMQHSADMALPSQVDHANRLFQAISHKLEELSAKPTKLTVPEITKVHQDSEWEVIEVPTSSIGEFLLEFDESFNTCPAYRQTYLFH